MLCRTLLVALLFCGLNSIASAQFVDEGEQGASQNDGSPADQEEFGRRGERGNRAERGNRGERGPRGERGEGFRGRGRPNRIFEVLDVDGDGMISARELRQAVRNLKELDEDGDGNISLEEASGMRGPGGFGDPEAMIDRMMENDANGDGELTPDEIPEFLARMLTGADTDASGSISREELRQAMQNMRGGPGGGFGGPGGGFGGGFGGPGFGGRADPETMTRQIMAADRNGDGVISANEMNPQMAAMLQGADTNGDGALNAKEVRQAVETMRQRAQQFRGQGRFGGGDRDQEAGNERDRRRGRGNQERN